MSDCVDDTPLFYFGTHVSQSSSGTLRVLCEKRFLVFMSDCVDDTPDYVKNQAKHFSRSIIFKFKHFPNFKDFVRTLLEVTSKSIATD